MTVDPRKKWQREKERGRLQKRETEVKRDYKEREKGRQTRENDSWKSERKVDSRDMNRRDISFHFLFSRSSTLNGVAFPWIR